MSSQYSYFLFSRWTKGERVEKSLPGQNKQDGQPQVRTESQMPSIDHYNQPSQGPSFGYDDSFSGCLVDTTSSSGFTRQANKRDSFNEILSGRDMHTQVGQNPFLAGESYLNHLKIQEDFLRPQNTNIMEAKKNG